jgi:hypothetical protein
MRLLAIAGLALAGWWAIQLAMVLRQPGPSGRFPFGVTRTTYLAVCVVGIVVGLALSAIGWVGTSS